MRKDERKNKEVMPDEQNVNEDIVYGRRPVSELFETNREVNKLLILKGTFDSSQVKKIVQVAKERKIPVQEVEKATLDRVSGKANHQGIIGYVSPIEYVEIEDILEIAKDKGEDLLVVLTDGIMDPQNLGSIIRTADACGAHGVIVPARRGAQVSSTVMRASAGAAVHLPVARVTNLVQAIEKLKLAGAWVVGTDLDAPKFYFDTDLKGKLAVVVGNEGEGISRLVKDKCDFTVKMPMLGKVNSLNAGVAWGIIAYEIMRQRAIY